MRFLNIMGFVRKFCGSNFSKKDAYNAYIQNKWLSQDVFKKEYINKITGKKD